MTNLLTDIENLKSHLKIGEKYALINKITKSANEKIYKNEEINTFLNSEIIKADKFTKILYVNITKNLQNNELFIKLLKTEDDQIISDTIRKFTYFYFQEIHNLEYYSKEIFPIISYSHRLLLLKILADNFENDKAELFFNELYKIYGLKIAKPFLKKCSQKFILEKLNNPGIVLQNFELKSFLIKYPKFVLEYLSKLITAFNDKQKMITKIELTKYGKLFQELLVCYPREVIELLSSCTDCEQHKFGKKNSKRCLKNVDAKNIIMKRPEFFSGLLTTSIIFKVLTKEEYIEFIKDFHPVKIKDFEYDISNKLNKYIDCYKKNEDKLNLLLKSYESRYGKQWLDNPKNLSPNIMKLLDKENRIKFVNEKLRNNDESYLKTEEWKCYLECETCIPIFKEQIKLASDSKVRMKYMEYIIESCVINDDMSALYNFLKYFNERHRNEMADVRVYIFMYMCCNLKLQNLTEEIWNQINLIWDIVDLNDEYSRLYFAKDFVDDTIRYTMNNNKLLERSIKNQIKLKRHVYYGEWLTFKNKDFNRKYIDLFGKLMPETSIDTNCFACCTYAYLYELIKWNKNNPKNPNIFSAVDYPWLIDEITKVLESDHFQKPNYIELLKKDKRANEYFKKQISEFNSKFRIESLETLAKENPELVKNSMDEIYDNIKSLHICRQHIIPVIKSGVLKNIEGVELGIRDFCWNIMKSDTNESWSQKPCAIEVLTYWLTSEEFFEIAKINLPKTSSVPTGNPIDKHVFELQTTIVYKLKDYKNHPEVFDVMRKFCVGDYLKLSIGTLNSLCIKSPFNKTINFLDACIDTPVSFQKHIIRLKCLIRKRNENLEFIKELWLKAKNPSIRQVILEITFNLFITTPDSNLWKLVNVFMESLNSKDKFNLDTILKFDQIPNKYLSDFIKLCWLTINKMEKEFPDLTDKKLKILNVINENIIIISNEFIELILNDNIFKHDLNDELQSGFNTLAAKYIYHGNDNTIQLQRIDNILNKLKISYEANWNKFTDNNNQITFPIRSSINNFLDEISTISIKDKNKFEHVSNFVLVNLRKKLLSLISEASSTLFDAQLQLQITQIYLQSNNFVEFGKNIRDILDSEILEKGDYIVTLFNNILTQFLGKVNDVELIDIVNGLLTEPIQSNGCALLGLLLIKPDIHKKENEHIKMLLMKMDNQKIKILLNMLF